MRAKPLLNDAATFLLAIIAASAAAVGSPAAAQELARKAALGIALAPPPGEAAGAAVQAVIPGLTGEKLGIRQGDIVVSAGGQAIASPGDLVDYAGSLRAGDAVALTVRRGTDELRLTGPAEAKPLETYADAAIDYGAVPYRDGHLRDILVTPSGAQRPPVLFLLPGFSCASIEPTSPGHPYRRLGASMVEAGIAYYRVEKPGLGDSTGSTQCVDIDYATELDAFRSAYRHLVQVRGVDPKRIFLFGHSLGGLQAPMLAAEVAPRGVAVFGTVYRNWDDYHRNVAAFQSFLMGGEDPVEGAERSDRIHGMFDRYYLHRQSPAEIAAEVPAYAQPLREVIAWNGGELAMGRHYKFMADLAHLPIAQAWRDSRSNVLSLYGESDLVALFDEDHRLIADVVNHYRPGTARYVEVAGTDHGMTLVGPLEQFRRESASGEPPSGEFNPEVARRLAEWISQSMAKAPVSETARPR